MKTIRRIYRLFFIKYILLKNFFSRKHSRGEKVRISCEELGPIFVKFGQLSTRVDLLPDDIAIELVKLQDQVPPFCGNLSRKMVEEALGDSISNLFAKFDTNPLASASVAQVHAATLFDGKDVIVKVLRPKINRKISQDIELLETIANFLSKYWKSSKRFKPKEIVAEFKKNIFDELDLMKEAANASQLRRNFHNSELLYVPEIYWPLTKSNVLVMERIYGTPVSNVQELKKNNTNLKKLAERGVEIFFTQVFRDCFFHADMHPGNVWVDLSNPTNPRYMALDFGIMGTLNPSDQRYLAENFLAFFKRNYKRVAELHVESGWIPASTRVDEFESAIRSVCEPIFERPLKDISFGKTLLRLFQTASRFNMEIQPQLLLLQKTLISIEGLGRQLYPDLDLWHTAKPFLEDWMKKRIGTKALFRQIKNNGPFWLEKLPDLPNMFYNALYSLSVIDTKTDNMHKQYLINNKKYGNLLLGFLLGIITSAGVFWYFNEKLGTFPHF
jgi:ubiquinone biosynthesis protein